MPDSYEMEETAQPDLTRYVGMVRRRYVPFLIAMLTGFVTVWGISFLLKPRYKSITQILVEQPSMPKNYVTPNVGQDLDQQLASIAQQVLSRERLLQIADEYNLFPGKEAAKTPDQKVAAMTKRIDVEVIRGDAADEITAFSLSYTGDSPTQAQTITRELATTVIRQNLAIRQEQSEQTTQFLDQQLQAAAEQLEQQNAKVKAYEAAHQGALPSQQQSNLQILTGLQQQLQAEQDALNQAVSQRVYYQSLIEQYRAIRGPVKGADGAPVNVAALNDTIEKERIQLADLRSRYTESYPDVQALEQQIRRTEKERDQALAASTANKSKEGAGSNVVADTADPNSPLLQLQGQLQQNQLEIANRGQAIKDLKARIDSYQARLGAEPYSEQELADLTRGYEQSQANYNDLLKKRDDSRMATSMEQMQQGQRFSVLEPATLPWNPDFPNRLKFCALGIAAGLLLGIVSVALFEFADDRMYGDKEIKALLPVPVISEIPEIFSKADQRSASRAKVLRWAATALVAFVVLMGTAISLVHP